MSSKVLVIFAVVCFFCSCWGKGSTTQSIQDIPLQPLESSSDNDLNRETSTWRFWRPFRFWKWGNMLNRDLTNSDDFEDLADRYPYPRGKRGKIKNKFKFLIKLQQFERMFYVDSVRATTRRDSSLITTKKTVEEHQLRSEIEGFSTARGRQSTVLCCESNSSLAGFRPKGSVQRELVTMMFDSMLFYIIDSWEVIEVPKIENLSMVTDFGKSPSELTVMSRRRKSAVIKPFKPKRSRSKIELNETQPVDPLMQSWFTSPDERAIIRFKNGNTYEGAISMKSMNGEGRYQWADGTVYLGQFSDNEIKGKGRIEWKDDTWYEGDFIGNLRHGRGLYVDSRGQRSYNGGWHLGTKHGKGVIYFSGFKNSYDGDWIYNVRHGFGSREYCANSGYRGDWDLYVREGKGLMIWPNHDYYIGDWKNGVMSGHGMYIWDAFYNNSMSFPSMIAYRGNWEKGYRNGFGLLNLGTGYGIHYKGEFKKNKKHGVGKFVTNDGFIIQSKTLFIDDNMAPEFIESTVPDPKRAHSFIEPLNFNMCDDTVGLIYHVEEALRNIDNQVEVRANMINDFIECNKDFDLDILEMKKSAAPVETSFFDLDDLIAFEEESLRKAIKCYETELKNIYYKYATICNTREIQFTPVLIRLYMWQFYYDCNVHEKGLTLIEIDRIFHRNPKWLSKSPHNPFEEIYFWQYLQCLIAVASKLYAKRVLPITKPDTILATAFRSFMDIDVLPGVGRCKGRLANGFGTFVPLRALYELYRMLGEPHTVRRFLASVRYSPHSIDLPQPPMVDTPDENLTIGRNTYVFEDEMIYAIDSNFRRLMEDDKEEIKNDEEVVHNDLKLFNFGNLSSKGIIKIFSHMFPWLCCNGKIMDLEIELTFFEFFEAFITCAEESIRVKDEELRWREKFSAVIEPALPPSPIGGNTVSKYLSRIN